MAFLDAPDRMEDKYRDSFELWQRNPSPTNTSDFLKTIKPEIDRGISAHVGRGNPMLRSRARRMALQAAKSYDPQKAGLGTHVVNQLQGLKRISRQQAQILPMPERVSLESAHIDRSAAELEEEMGREPTIDEIADHAGLSVKRIGYVRSFRYPVSEGSIIHRMQSSEEGGFMPAVEGQQSPSWMEFVYSDLDPTNQKIMEWTLGLHGKKPISNLEIAKRLRLSPGAISQRKSTIQTILDQEAELSPFRG